MALFIYVDNSNVLIEGQRVSAVDKRMAPDIFTAMTDGIVDHDWTFDYGRLYDLVGPVGDKVGRAVLFGSRPPPNDEIWQRAELEGWEPIIHDRNVANKEKKVDVQLATEMMRDLYKRMKRGADSVVLVAGDGDFIPAVEAVIEEGLSVHCLFWDQVNGELKRTVDRFTSLNPHLNHLRRSRTY